MPKINIHNTPIQHDDGFFGIWSKIGHGIMIAFDWIMHLQTHLNDMTVGLFVGVYKFLVNFILCTPTFLFNNSAVYSSIATFSGASMFLVTILSMVEGIKKIIARKKGKSQAQDSKKTWKRYLVAMGVSGSAPFLFTWGFKLINILIKLLSNVGVDKMENFNLFSSLHIPGLGILDVVLMLLFDVVLVGILIPISLQAGRRFYDLMCLSAISPLAMSAWVFDEHKHYFDLWWRNIKKLAQSQLVVAFFITIMGLFIFGMSSLSGNNVFPATILIIGGLSRMINPPSFIKNKMDHGDTIEDMGEDILQQGKKLYNTLTLKDVRTFGMLKKRGQNKKKKVAALRKQTGKRFNK